MNPPQIITLGMSGASGVQYGLRLLECLLNHGKQVYVTLSEAAQVVFAMETELQLPGKIDDLQRFFAKRFNAQPGQLQVFGNKQWAAPIASGSAVADAMVVCPCSSGCLSAIATGASDNLLERAADVTLKERKPLILVHRDTPLSAIHLQNMLTLTQVGALILPANPGFYHRPQSIDELIDAIVARILDHLHIENNLMARWGLT
ncbi:MAG: flavin prenyltransferase UbiX [Gammaproteobacteria bacterium]